jgi:hypothetical protein
MKQETVLAVMFSAVVLVATRATVAQPQAEVSRETALPTEIASAPDWLVWRAFHDSLRFYHRRSPDLVLDFIEQAGLGKGKDEADAFFVAGQDYLQELSRIDDEARAEIRTRYQRNAAPRFAPPDASLMSGSYEGVPPLPAILIAANTEDGRKLHDVLLADGFVAEVERRRQAAFRAHIEHLSRTIGATKLASIDERVRADVAPRVKVGIPADMISSPRR